MNMRLIVLYSVLSLVLFTGCERSRGTLPHPFPATSLDVQAELLNRLQAHMDKMEEPMYWPARLFEVSDSTGYYGGIEGRVLLAWVLDGHLLRRNPVYAEPLLARMQERINAQGYFGPVISGGPLDERQVAGNASLLRGLSAFHGFTFLEPSRALADKNIRSIVQGLFLAHREAFLSQPGKAPGWRPAPDSGVVYECLDGLTSAYAITRDTALRSFLGHFAERFLSIGEDLDGFQAYSVLTGMRGVLRFVELTGEDACLPGVERLWSVVKKNGFGEFYGVHGHLGRYGEPVDPSAVSAAFLTAAALWRATGNPAYLEDAELIYVNAFARSQRPTGGLGDDHNPDAQDPYARVVALELPYDGTPYGAEALDGVAAYGFCALRDTVFVPFLVNLEVSFALKGKTMKLRQTTDYPVKPSAVFEVAGPSDKEFVLQLPARSWHDAYKVIRNGVPVGDVPVRKGFLVVPGVRGGDRIEFGFRQSIRVTGPVNPETTTSRQFRLMYGSMVLCYNLPYEVTIARDTRIIPTSPGFFEIDTTYVEMIPRYGVFSRGADHSYPPQQILFDGTKIPK